MYFCLVLFLLWSEFKKNAIDSRPVSCQWFSTALRDTKEKPVWNVTYNISVVSWEECTNCPGNLVIYFSLWMFVYHLCPCWIFETQFNKKIVSLSPQSKRHFVNYRSSASDFTLKTLESITAGRTLLFDWKKHPSPHLPSKSGLWIQFW